ncbi:MAG: trypsin-like serine protease [Promethearchaeota archaeon]
MLQKQKIIFGFIVFFMIIPSIYIYNTENQFDPFLSKGLSPNYSLDDISNTINYNVLTGIEEIEYFSPTLVEQSIQTIIQPFFGENSYSNTLENLTPEISYPFPPDDRVRINNTSIFPWSTITKLYITAADDTEWIGSGAMLDEFHVLTCGHCVYLHGHGGWASEIVVVPGMRGPYRPFGQAFATNYRTYTEWTQSEMFQHDWAVITLDRTIGNQTGWMGRKTEAPSDPIYQGTLHTAGYPGDLDLGEYMYYDSDVGKNADAYNHWYWMDTAAGQSGGPVWQEENGSYYILTVNAYEYENGADANFGTRLNQDKFDQINIWLASDTPPENPGGWDPNLIVIIIIIASIGVVIVIFSIVMVSRRSRQKLKFVEPYEGPITEYNSESIPLITPQLYSQNLGICPNCGMQFFRDNQRFCSNCGNELRLESEE